MRHHRLPSMAVIATVLFAFAAALLGPVGTAWAGSVHNGASQPVYSYTDAIRESVWVDTGTVVNGAPVRVAADIIRPREPAAHGRRIPVIMDASPYYSCCGRGNESQVKTYDANGEPVQFPLYYDNYFVPRGYAVVLVDLAGTNRSDGCEDVGGPLEVAGAKSVIDWINGRATAHSSRTGGTEVKASWADGSVGMIGKSWDGTIANGVAATGVDGLKTIVPISAISSWYDYYRSQGAPLYPGTPADLASYVEDPATTARCATTQGELAAGAPYSGDWTSFWQQRDYVANADKVKASVFVVHGQQDLNVRTVHFGQWWDALAARGVPRKIWLSQTGHVDPFDYRRSAWVDTLHSWFDHYLMGVDNGIDRQPMADIERAPDQWSTDAKWPAPGTRLTTVHLNPGTLGGSSTNSGTVGFTDDPSRDENAWAADVDRSTPDKTVFSTGALDHDLRMSGSGDLTLTVGSSTTSAHLSAVLVDIGPATIRNYLGSGEGITTLTTRSCWGEGTPGDTGCFLDTAADTSQVGATVFSRGWIDLGHYASLDHGQALTPGTPYRMTVHLSPTDHVVPAGHRLALIVAGTDNGLIDPPDTKPTLTVDLGHSELRLPLVGGTGALPGSQQPRAAASQAAPLAVLTGRQPADLR
ncbi:MULTISPECIES: Xaa-Pro dipeptidyl-peptidase [Kitasatospora]|uniref:Xaa-Pro dipeptidyl-peptidase n=1 Tax=Kitasatospora TaxID=2063 RepID=UPI0024755775|nr:Xaa-Pro dipeptidyl-peptidase [Kitasatospora sp. GP30]MDH6140518.1 X-Pro dipeptidyl-peptidase [Kitasatospora sp. GP30]